MSHYERLNATLQHAVEHGVTLDAEQGAVKAWMFMQQRGVSETVMLRVLVHPNRRRNSDTVAIECARKDGFAQRPR